MPDRKEKYLKKIDIYNAVGCVLCHDITAMKDGFKGAWFKRGHIIEEKDSPIMLDLGKKTVFVWDDNCNLVHEEDAAKQIAYMVNTENVRFTEVSEGKTVMIADTDGMLRVDKNLLCDINSIGDITITTLPDHYPVKKGARLASMRIIPLATDKEQLEKAEKLCENKKLIQLVPYRHHKVGIIVTGSEFYSGRTEDKFSKIAYNKLNKYPCEILGVKICDDDTDMICTAAKEFISRGADLVVFSGGMSVDPDDVTPLAVKQLGAEIVSYGVPSQPGNMTLVAYLDDVTLLGVPGAAVSLPTTVFDVALPQIFTKEKFTKQQLVNLAEGGLCQLCDVCHFPNCTFGRY